MVETKVNGAANYSSLPATLKPASVASVQLKQTSPILTEDVTSTKKLSFEQLGLKLPIVKAAFAALKWEKPSPIQEAVIPVALEGKNIVARAKTGTGKTGSFLLPILNTLDLKDRSTIEALVLVPTRELSMQTSNLFISVSRLVPFEDQAGGEESQKSLAKFPKTLLLSGGTKIDNHINILKDAKNQGIKIIVGTCGRIIELINKGILSLENIKILVLDEADKMMNANNLVNIEKIVNACPSNVQKMLFSATYHQETSNEINKIVENPTLINIMENLTLKGISTYYCWVEEKKKILALNTIFDRLTVSQGIIFVNSTKRAEALCGQLLQRGYSCTYIHSRMPQHLRNQIFNDFKKNSHRIIVCTDIFERGIDHPQVNVVINFDIPPSSQHYVHRAGRAGRYGRKGITIDIVSKDQEGYARIMKELQIMPQTIPEEFDSSIYQNY